MLAARARVDAGDGERREVRRHADVASDPHGEQQRGGDGEAPGHPQARGPARARLPAAQRRAGVSAALDEGEIVRRMRPCHRPPGREAQPVSACATARACARRARGRGAPQPRHQHDRLERDPPGHLRRARARGRGTMIGTSTTRKPGLQRRGRSARPGRRSPCERTVGRSIASSTSRRKHLKPPVRSRDAQAEHAPRRTSEPPRLTTRRTRPQSRHAAAGDVARAEREVGVAARPRRAGARGPPGRGRSRRPSRARSPRRRRSARAKPAR